MQTTDRVWFFADKVCRPELCRRPVSVQPGEQLSLVESSPVCQQRVCNWPLLMQQLLSLLQTHPLPNWTLCVWLVAVQLPTFSLLSCWISLPLCYWQLCLLKTTVHSLLPTTRLLTHQHHQPNNKPSTYLVQNVVTRQSQHLSRALSRWFL